MPAYKDSKTGTWFVKFYCKDWTGENKQIKKRGFCYDTHNGGGCDGDKGRYIRTSNQTGIIPG